MCPRPSTSTTSASGICRPARLRGRWTKRVGAGADDAEEQNSTGQVDLASSDLELVNEPFLGAQTVGMRFSGLAIPPGATITSASARFTVDETGSAPAGLTFRAHASDNSTAFTTATGNVSSRPKTSASAAWSPPAWTSARPVGCGSDHAGSGGADPGGRLPTRLGVWKRAVADRDRQRRPRRVLFRGRRRAGAAAHRQLHDRVAAARHDAADGAVEPDRAGGVELANRPELGRLDGQRRRHRLRGRALRRRAVHELRRDRAAEPARRSPIRAWRRAPPTATACGPATPPATGRRTATPSPPRRPTRRRPASPSGLPRAPTTPRSRSAAAPWISSAPIWSSSTSSSSAPRSSACASPASRSRATRRSRPAPTSSSRPTRPRSGSCSLTIRGQAADSAATFTTSNKNISNRAATTASTAWSPPAWPTAGAAGAAQRTADLSSVIQQIVNRPGWVSGNSLVLIFSGSCTRIAKAWNGEAGAAPQLVVDYV